jgi:hypothetical protein
LIGAIPEPPESETTLQTTQSIEQEKLHYAAGKNQLDAVKVILDLNGRLERTHTHTHAHTYIHTRTYTRRRNTREYARVSQRPPYRLHNP